MENGKIGDWGPARLALAIGAGVALGFAMFYAVQAVVIYLLAPIITLFVGHSPLAVNSFNVGTTEFRYGAAIEGLLVFAAVVGLIAFWWRTMRRILTDREENS